MKKKKKTFPIRFLRPSTVMITRLSSNQLMSRLIEFFIKGGVMKTIFKGKLKKEKNLIKIIIMGCKTCRFDFGNNVIKMTAISSRAHFSAISYGFHYAERHFPMCTGDNSLNSVFYLVDISRYRCVDFTFQTDKSLDRRCAKSDVRFYLINLTSGVYVQNSLDSSRARP